MSRPPSRLDRILAMTEPLRSRPLAFAVAAGFGAAIVAFAARLAAGPLLDAYAMLPFAFAAVGAALAFGRGAGVASALAGAAFVAWAALEAGDLAGAAGAFALASLGLGGLAVLVETLLAAHDRAAARERSYARAQRIGGVGGFEIDCREGLHSTRSPEYLDVNGLGAEARHEPHAAWVARLHPDDRAVAEARFFAALEGPGEVYENEYRIVRPTDGEIRHIQAKGEIRRDAQGRAVRFVGAHVDITSLRRAEAALRDVEERLRRFEESGVVGMLHGDVHGGVARANDEFLRIVGRDRGSFERDGLRWDEITPPEWLPVDAARIAEAQANGACAPYEKEYLRPDGSRVPVVVGYALTGPARERSVAFVLDVSARKATEAQRDLAIAELERVNASLEAQVAEKTREAREATERLFEARRMEAAARLAGGVAHDFNNLLAAALSNLEIARKRVEPGPARERIDAAMRAAERGAALTSRLLLFASGRPLEAEDVDVGALLSGLQERLAHAPGPPARLAVELPADLPPVRADRWQLELALTTLIANARDASAPDAAIRIEADAPPAEAEDRRVVRLRVVDRGAGMAPEVLARAGEPFFTTKPVGSGAGLGLAAAIAFARQSGGELRLASRPGEGTTAELTLPVAAGPADAAPDEARPAVTRLRVLAVDDDPLVAMGTAAMLEDLGHEVIDARNGQDALALARREPIDIVVTDHSMPGMTGQELARRLKALRPDLPVVLATGYDESAAGEFALPRLAKPFAQAELSEALQAAMDGTRAPDQRP